MKPYITLNSTIYDLERLTAPQKRFIKKVIACHKRKPHWNKFGNYWIREGKAIWKNMDQKEVVKHPTFKICQDLESRLGIEQGYVRQTDYRDELLKIVEQFPSRYVFCKRVGVDEAFLSHVLAKRKNFSLTKLEDLLSKLNLVIRIAEKPARKNREKTLQI